MRSRSLLFALLLSLALPPAFADSGTISEEKSADIRQLIKVTGSLKVGQQLSEAFIAQMTHALKTSHPELPPEIYDVIAEEVNAIIGEALPTFVELIVPVYDKHFSAEEIKGLLAFYSTELGRKTIQVMPALIQDSMQLGEQWGRALGPEVEKRILQRLKTEGVDLSA